MTIKKNSLHLIVSRKGGVGTSTIASVLATYFAEQGGVLGYDTNYEVPTFLNFKTLREGLPHAKIKKSNLITYSEQAKMMNVNEFENLINEAEQSNIPIVVDIGASNNDIIFRFLKSEDFVAVDTIVATDVSVVIHIPIIVGQMFDTSAVFLYETINDFSRFKKADGSPVFQFVIWENNVNGDVREYKNDEGKNYLETEKSASILSHISGFVVLSEVRTSYTEMAFSKMLDKYLTFIDVKNSHFWGLIEKSILNKYKCQIWEQLDALFNKDDEESAVDVAEKMTEKSAENKKK